jgi:Icc-related predicted phosphoesterase
MLIQLVSDLHGEIRGLEEVLDVLEKAKQALVGDVLVMAGDICNWKDKEDVGEILEYVQTNWRHTIWVAGNHEYYGTDPSSAEGAMEDAWDLGGGFPSVDVVYSPRIITIDDQRFVCGTGWYPQSSIEVGLGGDPDIGTFWEHGTLYQWSDFRKIKNLAPWVYGRANELAQLLEVVCADDIVVTHMLPSRESTPRQFQGAATNAFFVHDFEAVIAKQQPKMWIHGHTHTPFDYWFGSTRIVCNPLGAPNERHTSVYTAKLLEA